MQTSIFKWLLRGSMLVGLSFFGACGEPAQSNNNTTGGGQCTANTATDPQNCGSCGRACTVGQACSGGACVASCTAPQTNCNGMCADTANNALHCGGCGMMCGAGQICQNNACITGSCPGGQMLCVGACVDTQTNVAACGATCTPCLIGQTCQAGVCTGGSGGAGGTGNAGGVGGSAPTGGTGGSDSSGGTGGSNPTGGTGGTGQTTTDCRIWMAENGSDSGDGSEGAPFLTLVKAYDTLCPPPVDAPNGTECTGPAPRTICVKPGTYDMTERFEFRKTRMGTASNRVILQGDPNSAQKPVFDFSGQDRLECGENPTNRTGITINAHYVTVKNIEVSNANDNCILVQGANGLVENVVTHHCADTGIQISSGDPFEGSGTNNTVLNCDSYSNYDVQCEGENADGFAIKEGTGAGNVFSGCRAWDNTDDGYDFYAWTTPVRLENSWAFAQCETTEDTGSDCNGFKLGGNNVNTLHQLSDLVAVGNSGGDPGAGFNENTNPANLMCTGTCASWDNDIDVDSVGGVSTNPIGNANITNMRAASARNADGSLKAPSAL